jgi:hypothetical protein
VCALENFGFIFDSQIPGKQNVLREFGETPKIV